MHQQKINIKPTKLKKSIFPATVCMWYSFF